MSVSAGLITADREKRWLEVLNAAGDFDAYHLPRYHRLAEREGRTRGFLFFFHEGDKIAAMPFLVKEIGEVEGLRDSKLRDALSVYGYPGVVSNVGQEAGDGASFRLKFQAALVDALRELKIVAFCSRLNPLISTSWLLRGRGKTLTLGETVAIDLTPPLMEQWKSVSSGHRRGIRRLRSEGFSVSEDKTLDSLPRFAAMYAESMARVGADEDYYFPPEYFSGLRDAMGNKLRLFWAVKDGAPITGILFLMTGRIIQAHLAAAPKRFAGYGAIKLILDDVRILGSESGYELLNLGGGLGAKADSILNFKTGFSRLKFPFEIFQLILEPEVYQKLCRQKRRVMEESGKRERAGHFFPRYRARYD